MRRRARIFFRPPGDFLRVVVDTPDGDVLKLREPKATAVCFCGRPASLWDVCPRCGYVPPRERRRRAEEAATRRPTKETAGPPRSRRRRGRTIDPDRLDAAAVRALRRATGA